MHARMHACMCVCMYLSKSAAPGIFAFGPVEPDFLESKASTPTADAAISEYTEDTHAVLDEPAAAQNFVNVFDLRRHPSNQASHLGLICLKVCLTQSSTNLTKVQKLFLQNNQLTGATPPELGNLTKLQKMYLQNNQLSGATPPELGMATCMTKGNAILTRLHLRTSLTWMCLPWPPEHQLAQKMRFK